MERWRRGELVVARLDRATQYTLTYQIITGAYVYWITRFRG
jgi:hypothetical protein